MHDIKTVSGKHRHQGGLLIYVLEGKGYSIVNGERKDWQKGDLVLLPMVPGGVEHQHFNVEPEKGAARWIAFINMPIQWRPICSRSKYRRTSNRDVAPTITRWGEK